MLQTFDFFFNARDDDTWTCKSRALANSQLCIVSMFGFMNLSHQYVTVVDISVIYKHCLS